MGLIKHLTHHDTLTETIDYITQNAESSLTSPKKRSLRSRGSIHLAYYAEPEGTHYIIQIHHTRRVVKIL